MFRRVFVRVAAEQRSVRVRILAVVLAFMAIGLTLAGAVTFTVQWKQLNSRVNAELRQEMHELERLALAGPEADGVPYQDLETLFLSFLQSGVAGEYETMMGVIGGEATYLSGGNRPFELNRPEVLRVVTTESRSGWTVTRDIYLDDKLVRMSMVSVELPDDPRQGVMVIAIDLSSQRASIIRMMQLYLLVGVATLLLAGIAGWVMAGRVMKPVRELRETTGRITVHDLGRRVEVNPQADADLNELAMTFNTMLDRLEEAFTDQRQFLDDVAHELRTPLTIIQGNLELADEHDPADIVATRELLMDELDRMQRLVDDLLTLARAGRPDFLRPTRLDVPELAEELFGRLRALGDRTWSCESSAGGSLIADRQRIIQAVVQLAANAVKFSAVGDGVSVHLAWRRPSPAVADRCAATQHYLAIEVSDTGVGIELDQQERIFDRFARAANAGRAEGSGLGLAIVSAIMDAHGGTVELVSQPGEGATFTLWLPGREAELPQELNDAEPEAVQDPVRRGTKE